MRVEKVDMETAFIKQAAALDLMEQQRERLSEEAVRWHDKYTDKMRDLQKMDETLQEVRAGRAIAREQVKNWEVKKEPLEDDAAEPSNMAEQLAETAELKKKLDESLLRISELEADLSSGPGDEGGGDAEREREGERESGNQEAKQTPTTTQQMQISVDSESKRKERGEAAGRALDAMFARVDSEANSDSTHADYANKSAASQSPSPTADISLSAVMSENQSDAATDYSASLEVQKSRESVLANMTVIDVYDILRKQYGPDACFEITTVHDWEPITAGGVGGENVGAEGGRGGLIMDGYPVRGIPGFSKTTKHTLEPTPIHHTTLANLQNEHAQLQQKYDDLQIRYNAAIASEEAIRLDRYNSHLHYLDHLGAAIRRQDEMQDEAFEMFDTLALEPPKNADIALSIERFEKVFRRDVDRAIGTLLGSPHREAEDLGRKHLFHHGRAGGPPSQSLLAECKRVEGRSLVVTLIPSRHDQMVFPAAWAWLDQKFSSGGGTKDMWEQQWNRFEWSSYAQWPEVRLAAFSWAFYKLLDSACGEDPVAGATREEAALQFKLQYLMDSAESAFSNDAPEDMKDKYGFDD